MYLQLLPDVSRQTSLYTFLVHVAGHFQVLLSKTLNLYFVAQFLLMVSAVVQVEQLAVAVCVCVLQTQWSTSIDTAKTCTARNRKQSQLSGHACMVKFCSQIPSVQKTTTGSDERRCSLMGSFLESTFCFFLLLFFFVCLSSLFSPNLCLSCFRFSVKCYIPHSINLLHLT